ncbi:hypothetical protein G9A89_013949 [Geosiphon pyriformis]|nr:hypothetical protein G9A89_013949 [Geosiphon pyriformis]
MFSNEFAIFTRFSDLDAMWDAVCKIMVLSANEVFKKKWFKGFDDIFTKKSSRFHKLELLVSRIVRVSHEESIVNFDSLNIMDSDANFDYICSVLSGSKRSYCTAKLTESLRAKKANIKSAIDKRIESFKIDKDYMIKSILECLFRKVALNHLVVNDELILESDLVKSKYVFDKAFSDVMHLIEFDKLVGMVSNLSNGKAAGLLDVLNKL